MSRAKCPGQNIRYWTPDDVFELRCPHCGVEVEFFKDEPRRLCRACRRWVPNPKFDLGCAEWCKYAKECLGELPQKGEELGSRREQLIAEMKAYFENDQRRIDHALKVLAYAEQILTIEPADPMTVKEAAILHDIGIPQAERKHGSSAGKYQEIEGPPIAREIMARLDLAEHVIDHVCRIVGSHHSAKDIDTPEFRIIWDADRLVNIPDEYPNAGRERLSELIEKVFKTAEGKQLAMTQLLQGNDNSAEPVRGSSQE